MVVEVKKYSKEDKDQILREVRDTGNMALVARNRGIAYQTVVSWVGS
jgi:transposase-like protein